MPSEGPMYVSSRLWDIGIKISSFRRASPRDVRPSYVRELMSACRFQGLLPGGGSPSLSFLPKNHALNFIDK
jgi:hypothetical protein